MALFGRKDDGMPLINQLIQLEFDPKQMGGSELHEWAAAQCARQQVDKNPLHEDDVFLVKSLKTPGLAREAGPALECFSEIYSFAQGLFQEIVEKGTFSVLHLQTLEYLANGYLMASPSVSISAVVLDEVTPGKLRYAVNDSVSPRAAVLKKIVGELVNGLQRWNAGEKAFRQCPVCQNPFLANRADQQLCSRRCSDRKVARRRRAEGQEGEKANPLMSLFMGSKK